MGDSRLPAGPGSSNSLATASLGSAVKLAANKVRARLGNAMPATEERAAAFARLGVGEVSEVGEFLPPGKTPEVLDALRKGQVPFANQARGDESKDGKPLMFAFGAELVEVRIHRLTREIRVPRMAGRVRGRVASSTRAPARSQYMGGMIWGMASALLEATELDERAGPLRQRQPRRVPDRRQVRTSPQRRRHPGPGGGSRGQSPGREGHRRARHRRHRRGHRQRRPPRHRQAHPRPAHRHGQAPRVNVQPRSIPPTLASTARRTPSSCRCS